MAIIAAFVPLSEIAKLVNIGTLFAFLIVNVGVIILRRTAARHGALLPRADGAAVPDHRRGPVHLPDDELEAVTWLRFFGWLALGLVIYFVYGRTHSRLQRGEDAPPPAEGEPAAV